MPVLLLAAEGLPPPGVTPHGVRLVLFGFDVGLSVRVVFAGLFALFVAVPGVVEASGLAPVPVPPAPIPPAPPAAPPALPAAPPAPPPASPPPPPPPARPTPLVPANKRNAAKTVPSLRDVITTLLMKFEEAFGSVVSNAAGTGWVHSAACGIWYFPDVSNRAAATRPAKNLDAAQWHLISEACAQPPTLR